MSEAILAARPFISVELDETDLPPVCGSGRLVLFVLDGPAVGEEVAEDRSVV